MITLQFSLQDKIGSAAISFLTRTWASHVDFVLPNGKLLGALALEGGGGVLIHNMKPFSYYKRLERYTVDAPDEVLKYALTQVGKPYDWSGVFGFFDPNRDWQDDSKWYCSELVMQSFVLNGIHLIRNVNNKISPGDLLLSPKLNYLPL